LHSWPGGRERRLSCSASGRYWRRLVSGGGAARHRLRPRGRGSCPLSVDPSAVGGSNDYDYVSADPINSVDLDGKCKSRRGSGFKRRGCNLVNAGRRVRNAAPTAIGVAYTYASGGSCKRRQTMYACTGARYPFGARAFAFGDAIVSRRSLSRREWEHERRHAYQWGALGSWFLPAYAAGSIRGACKNPFERAAGLGRGGYRC
jgi:hypothetical protein